MAAVTQVGAPVEATAGRRVHRTSHADSRHHEPSATEPPAHSGIMRTSIGSGQVAASGGGKALTRRQRPRDSATTLMEKEMPLEGGHPQTTTWLSGGSTPNRDLVARAPAPVGPVLVVC